jgi:hypothetical protein
MNKEKSTIPYTFSNGIRVGCFDRNRAEDTNWSTYYIRKNHIVGNQKDEFIDLGSDLLEAALKRTKEIKQNWGDKNYPAPEVVRQEYRPATNPLLLIYPLNPECANIKDKEGKIINGTISHNLADEPFIGLAISFPGSKIGDSSVSYTVNQIAEFADTENSFEREDDNNYYDEQ